MQLPVDDVLVVGGLALGSDARGHEPLLKSRHRADERLGRLTRAPVGGGDALLDRLECVRERREESRRVGALIERVARVGLATRERELARRPRRAHRLRAQPVEHLLVHLSVRLGGDELALRVGELRAELISLARVAAALGLEARGEGVVKG